jgi:hypothetical protein
MIILTYTNKQYRLRCPVLFALTIIINQLALRSHVCVTIRLAKHVFAHIYSQQLKNRIV